LSTEELLQRPIVTFARNTRPYADLTKLIGRAAAGPARIHASASLATIVRMARDGLGIAVIPPVIVAEELARGRLRELATKDTLPDLTFVAAWLENPDPDIVARVVDIACEIAAGAQLKRRDTAGAGRRTTGRSPKAATAKSPSS
jgi:DNA-binding transcriptional LysR family regulator